MKIGSEGISYLYPTFEINGEERWASVMLKDLNDQRDRRCRNKRRNLTFVIF